VNLVNPFRRDARRALTATPVRRLISGAPLLLLMIAAIVVGGSAPWWLWPILVLIDLLIFAVVGHTWANRDAVEMDQP
jgi:hypothetical protein